MSHKDKYTREVNDAFQYVPELQSSNYATYPMTYNSWLNPSTGVAPNGDPAFIAQKPPQKGEAKPMLKTDYVWGAGPMSWGYYHILTKQFHQILQNRLEMESSQYSCCCSCFGGNQAHDPKRTKALDLVIRVEFYRAKSPKPNDTLAVANNPDETGARSTEWYS